MATNSIESALSPSDAYFVIARSPPLVASVAIPALSYPRFFKIVRPSSKNSLASVYFEVPITPTIPQQSVVFDAESDVAKAAAAAVAATMRAAAFFALYDSDSDKTDEGIVERTRTDDNLAEEVDES